MDAFINAILAALREIFGYTTPASQPGAVVPSVLPTPKPQALPMGPKWVFTTAVQFLQAKAFKTAIDPVMVATMAKIESSYNPNAVRLENQIGDMSVGLMQTLVGTARDMVLKGYRAFHTDPQAVTGEVLKDPRISIYYGMAYIDWLQKNYSTNPEWVVRGYNGGPGWNKTANGQKMTLNHYTKYAKAYPVVNAEIKG